MPTQAMHKIYKYALILAAIQAVALAAVVFHIMAGPTIIGEYLNSNFKDNLEFTFQRCDDESTVFNNTISKSYWNGSDLIIEGVVVPNCGATWMFGDYQASGNNLVLKYRPIYSSLMLCECAQDVQYRISGMEKRDYELSIIEEGGVIVEPTWYHKLFTSAQ